MPEAEIRTETELCSSLRDYHRVIFTSILEKDGAQLILNERATNDERAMNNSAHVEEQSRVPRRFFRPLPLSLSIYISRQKT